MSRWKQPTAGIVLAAGMSQRFEGTKQLVRFKGKYLLERVLDDALNSQLEHVVLVLGHDADTILKALNLARPGCTPPNRRKSSFSRGSESITERRFGSGRSLASLGHVSPGRPTHGRYRHLEFPAPAFLAILQGHLRTGVSGPAGQSRCFQPQLV